MKDSRVGAAGVQALLVVLLLRGAGLICLAERSPLADGSPLAAALAAPLAMVWAAFWARFSPLLAMQYFPYLREQGSAGFHRQHWRGLARELRPVLGVFLVLVLLVGALLALGGVFVGAGLPVLQGAALGLLGGLVLWGAVGVVPAVLVPLWLGRRLGGHSGDSYGACVEWSEALALLFMGLVLRAAG
jgi:adenosylcobinamide-GDP ribazoletransferase